jgi:hypothetical protein
MDGVHHQLIRRCLSSLFITVAAFAVSASSLWAQTDILRGRVIGFEGQPLSGVAVTATSIPGNVTRNTRTNNQGQYQIVFPGGTGDYMMGFALVGFEYRQFQVKRLADEAVLIADARLAPMQLDTLMVQASIQQRVTRTQQNPDVGGTQQTVTPDVISPELQGNLAAMAASLPGVMLLPGLDGEPDMFSVLGMGGDQNSMTLNGLQSGGNNLPRDANVSSSLTTSPFDVSRGGFSGGNFDIRSRPGSNIRSRGMSLLLTTPQLQWTDRAAQALGNDYTNISLGGSAAGPLKTNKAFYNVSYQLGRQSRDNRSLLSTNALGLQTAGVASDSVTRFVDILNGYGIPMTTGDVRSNRVSDSGSVFGSVDLSPPSSASGQSIGFNFGGNFSRNTPTASNALALASSAGENLNWGGNVQARHSGYLKLFLSETSAGFNVSTQDNEPYLQLPGGRVRVSSEFEDGNGGVQSLTFGGNQSLGTESRSFTTNFQNSLSWFDNANKHRLKLTTELQYNNARTYQGSNLLGSYTFNSLEDLEAGRPASFSRTLTARRKETGNVTGSLSLGDTYRHSPDVNIQWGLRLDANRYTTAPQRNALVEETFGRRNDALPSPIVFSPRIGFSWTLGQAPEVAAFAGAVRGPRAILRGGIGVFSSNLGTGQIGQALDNTGLPSGVQQLMCVGPAVPVPNWEAFAQNADMIPGRCADGSTGTVFSNASPNVVLFADDYAPSRTVRSNLSWSGSILDARFSASIEGTYSVNLNQQRSLDLNFDGTPRFTLADGRPVFVADTSIVPATGTIASRDARVSQSFARVTEMRSDLQSRTAQLSMRVSPRPQPGAKFSWSAAYTYTNVREQVSGFSSTAGDPLQVEWARSSQGPHSFNYTLRYNFFNAVQVSWSGSLRSGSAFTPTVAGDINGDGYVNDRAFIFSPDQAPDETVAEGMQQLLDNASGRTRDCLQEQLGRIAGRNSCRGPWTFTNSTLRITLDRAKFRMPNRGTVEFSLTNPLGAADLLVNGSGDLRGWGQSSSADPSLLYVRGFDAATQQYRYEVNQRFGATRPQFMTFRQPAILTAQFRIDLGPTREHQSLTQQLAYGRSMPGSRYPESLFRSFGSSGVPNAMSTILRSQDSLKLSAVQADSIAAMNRRYTYRADSLWTPVARYFAALPLTYDEEEAYDRYRDARRKQVDMLLKVVTAVRELLTPEQRRKLPPAVLNYMDPRYLISIRDGTRMFLASGGGGIPGGEMMFMASGGMMEAPVMIIR